MLMAILKLPLATLTSDRDVKKSASRYFHATF